MQSREPRCHGPGRLIVVQLPADEKRGTWMKRRAFLRAASMIAGAAAVRTDAAVGQKPTGVAWQGGEAPGGGGVELNVRAEGFGARGDGVNSDTAALQTALDRCAVLGGGTVVVPAGRYLTGSLEMRSRTTLRLEEGRRLWAHRTWRSMRCRRCGGRDDGLRGTWR
jgi:hypothetical protein